MDAIERLIDAFTARPAVSVYRKLDVLLDLERLQDPRIVPFLLRVLQDGHEPLAVRSRIIRLLRAGTGPRAARADVAGALVAVLAEPASPELRVAAALALAEFGEVPGVAAALGALALAPAEPLDLRYSAFTALGQAGPSAERAALLRQLASDETLGQAARSLLARWPQQGDEAW